MTGRPHFLSQIVSLLLLFALGTLSHGCQSQNAPTPTGKKATPEATVKESGASLRESDPPDRGKIWRNALFDDPIIGYHSEKSGYHISHTFGIEQWEDGKRTTHRFQQWYISCDYPGYLRKNRTECSLERLVIDDFTAMTGGGATIAQFRHSEEEGNLVLRQADWKKGQIDFAFTYTDQSSEEVTIRFRQAPYSLVLNSFKAVSLGRGFISNEPQSVEHKIARYTYILNVPVIMRGMYDAGLKQWDALFATLSPADQSAWDELVKSDEFKDDKAWNKEYEQRLKHALPNMDLDAVNKGKREPSPQETEIVKRVVKESVLAHSIKILSKSHLSEEAKQKIKDYAEVHLLD